MVGVPSKSNVRVPDHPAKRFIVFNGQRGSLQAGQSVPYEEYRDFCRAHKAATRHNSELYSLRCDFQYKLEVGGRGSHYVADPARRGKWGWCCDDWALLEMSAVEGRCVCACVCKHQLGDFYGDDDARRPSGIFFNSAPCCVS